MRIAVIGDVHSELDRLEAVLGALKAEQPELALLVGDIGEDPPWTEPERSLLRAGHDASVIEVVTRTARTLDAEFCFVPGNHDLPVPAAVLAQRNIDGRSQEAAGLRLAGFGGSGPDHHGFPYEWRDEQAEVRLEELHAGLVGPLDILVAHAPPADTSLDELHRGGHVGSRALARWLPRLRPRLFVCGHIHEAWGLEWIDNIPCLNVGALGEPFGRPMGWIVDWEDGPIGITSITVTAEGPVRKSWWSGGQG